MVIDREALVCVSEIDRNGMRARIGQIAGQIAGWRQVGPLESLVHKPYAQQVGIRREVRLQLVSKAPIKKLLIVRPAHGVAIGQAGDCAI